MMESNLTIKECVEQWLENNPINKDDEIQDDLIISDKSNYSDELHCNYQLH